MLVGTTDGFGHGPYNYEDQFFMQFVVPLGSHWLWKGKYINGVPMFSDSTRQVMGARVWAWQRWVPDSLFDGFMIWAECGDGRCVQPAVGHLVQVPLRYAQQLRSGMPLENVIANDEGVRA